MPEPTPVLSYLSAFDIIGPVMVGPSSSHTAGALRLGRVARKLLGDEPVAADFVLLGSFAETFRGHGTDRALVAGILGLATDDPRVPEALSLADTQGLRYQFRAAPNTVSQGYHPNTVTMTVYGSADQVRVTGSSLGGGKIEVTEIDGFHVRISGDFPAIVIWHQDVPGVLAAVVQNIAHLGINIGRLTLDRTHPGGLALGVIELDSPQEVTASLLDALSRTRLPIVRQRWIYPI